MSRFRALFLDLNLAIACVAALGAALSAEMARETHALAPVCGGAHCPACYVAASLSLFALWRAALWLRPAFRIA